MYMKKSRLSIVHCLIVIFSIAVFLTGCGKSAVSSGKKDESLYLTYAGNLLEEKNYYDAYLIYSLAVSNNQASLDAWNGEIEALIQMGRYGNASEVLNAALEKFPEENSLYDKYFALGLRSGDNDIAQNAIAFAKEHNIETILDQLPHTPEASLASGSYDEKKEVSLKVDDESTIIYSLTNEDINLEIKNKLYTAPIPLCHGTTTIDAYSVKDDMQSEAIHLKYVLGFPETSVNFSDEYVERVIRSELNNTNGPITNWDCERVQAIDYRSEIAYPPIRSLSDFTLLPNLIYIYLNDIKEISDFSPLSECYQLKILEFEISDNIDLKFLSDLKPVEHIVISKSLSKEKSEIVDVTALKELPNLASVYLSSIQIKDLSPLLDCPKLTNLSLVNCGIQNTNDLVKMDFLQSLDVKKNPIEDISPLIENLDLWGLSIDAKSLPNLSQLSNEKSLRSLDIDELEGSDISFIENLTDLEQLFLDGVNPEQLSHLKGLKKLRNLYITTEYDKEVNDLSFLSDMKELRYLGIYSTPAISDLSMLTQLKSLKNLEYLQIDVSEDPQEIEAKLKTELPNCDVELYYSPY